jgi:hypothetical protein
VVREKGERTTFWTEIEMLGGKVGSQEFTVKCGIAGFSGESLWEKKAKGYQEPREHCCNTAPTWDAEASVAKESGAVEEG